MDFAYLQKQIAEDERLRRRKSVQKLDDKSLVAIVVSPVSDVRQVVAAKTVLKERGVKGIPE